MFFCLLTFVFIPIFNATDGESPTLMTGAGVHEHSVQQGPHEIGTATGEVTGLCTNLYHLQQALYH
jgi:hypothetical protein